jgi:hypothetical protein
MKFKAGIIGVTFSAFLLGMVIAAETPTAQAQSPFNQWMYARYRKKRGGAAAKKTTKTTKRKVKKAARRNRR